MAINGDSNTAKGKRSKRNRSSVDRARSEDEYLALCLMRMARGGSSPPPAPRYKCSLCGKAFASYQALGGHKASHRKPTAEAHVPRAGPSTATDGAKRSHQCSLCLMVFASGQALGGHKRRHYNGSGAGAGLSASTSSRHRGFDLNLPAADEEEEVLSPLAMKKNRLLISA